MTIKYHVDEKRPFFGKFWPQGLPHQLDYDYSLTLRDLLNRAAKQWANDPAIWFLDSWVTYGQLKKMVDSFATGLYNLGMRKGDVLAIHLPNSIQYIVAYYAAASIGAIATGINPTYKSMEILHQLKITGAKYIVVLDALYEHYIKEIEGKWDFKGVIWTNLVDQATGLSFIKKFLGKKIKRIPTGIVDHPKAIRYMDLIKTVPNVPDVPLDAVNDTAVLMTTGGTTGVPKAAILTHQNIVSNAIQCQIFLTMQRESESAPILGHKTGMVGVLPLFHSFAMTTVMNTTIATGSYMILFPKPPPAEELLQDIVKLPNYNGFVYCAAEILFQRIASLPDEVLKKYDIAGRLKLCISGAGPLHDYVRDPFEKKTGAKITEGYGLAEASPVVSANNFYGTREAGFIGVPMPGTDWNIFPADDFTKGPVKQLGEEGTGEICVCGPQVMKGYLNEPEQTADHIKDWDGRKWLLTGDIGYMDEYGRVTIRDRKKQLIKVKGYSVFPKEVETLVGNHPKVLEVAVAGIPDKASGEIIKAWVALKPEEKGTLTAEELLAWCKQNITSYKVPKYIEIIEEVPKNAIGKVMRRILQENDPMWKAAQKEGQK